MEPKPTINLLAPSDQKKWKPIWFKCFQSIKSINYPFKIWNDKEIDNFLKLDDEYFFDNYLSKLNPIYKFDYVRYLILEKYGGIYADMDIEIVNNFIPLLKKNKIYLMEGDIGELYSNCLMISPIDKTTREVWKVLKLFCKQRIIDNIKICKDSHNVLHIVGPFALSEWFSKYFSNFSNLPKVGVLSKYHFSQIDSDICFTKHHATNSWV
jgi:mannosyltransferase OCH1-like enzyme